MSMTRVRPPRRPPEPGRASPWADGSGSVPANATLSPGSGRRARCPHAAVSAGPVSVRGTAPAQPNFRARAAEQHGVARARRSAAASSTVAGRSGPSDDTRRLQRMRPPRSRAARRAAAASRPAPGRRHACGSRWVDARLRRGRPYPTLITTENAHCGKILAPWKVDARRFFLFPRPVARTGDRN